MFFSCRRSLNLFIFYTVASAPIGLWFWTTSVFLIFSYGLFFSIISYSTITSSSINDDLLFPNILPPFKSAPSRCSALGYRSVLRGAFCVFDSRFLAEFLVDPTALCWGSKLTYKAMQELEQNLTTESNVCFPCPQSVSWWVQSLPGAEGGEVEGWRSSGHRRRSWRFVGQEEIETCNVLRQPPFLFFCLRLINSCFLICFSVLISI